MFLHIARQMKVKRKLFDWIEPVCLFQICVQCKHNWNFNKVQINSPDNKLFPAGVVLLSKLNDVNFIQQKKIQLHKQQRIKKIRDFVLSHQWRLFSTLKYNHRFLFYHPCLVSKQIKIITQKHNTFKVLYLTWTCFFWWWKWFNNFMLWISYHFLLF